MKLSRRQNKFQWFSRLGYASRGVIYLVIGWLALSFALGQGGETADSKQALKLISYQEYGELMLGVVAVGFVAFALWRGVQAIADSDDHGTSLKGLVIRAGLLFSTFLHLSLAFVAVSIIFELGTNMQSNDQQYADWSAWLLAKPAGQMLVAGLGVIAIGAGVAHFIKAAKKTFLKYMAMSPHTKPGVVLISQVGLSARGFVLMIIGWFFVVVAYTTDPSAARGVPGALLTLHQQPYGPWLLGLTAVGLVCFGIYSLLEAVFRRIQRSL